MDPDILQSLGKIYNPALNTNRIALTELADRLGEDTVVISPSRIEPLLENTTEFELRDVPAILYPRSPADVKEIIEVAGKHSLPLYPYSTGKNWGLGSKLPVTNGCALVDLGLLNSIREVNVEQHYAIIEPGVTQVDLSNFLRENNIPLMLNVTGSSPQSSIIGNALERGTAFYNHRTEDIRGLEIVTGAGDVLKTGFWHYGESDRPIHHYKYGIGPALDGLFTQSNFGIVTAAVINLIPKPESLAMLWFTFTEDKLTAIVDTLSNCYKQGLLQNCIHIGNDKRMKITSTGSELLVWTGMGAIAGNSALVEFLKGEIENLLKDLCQEIFFYTEDNLPDNHNMRDLLGLHRGIPSEVFLKAMYTSVDEIISQNEFDIDLGRYGMLCCLPILPMEGRHVQGALTIVGEVFSNFGFEPAITFNPMNGDYLESVVNIYFDRRNKDRIEAAHQCNIELHRVLFKNGYRFYRVDIEMMGTIVDRTSSFWRTVSEIKKVLDPHGIIAPGRYNIL